MDRCSDAAGLWVKDAVPWGVRRVAKHDTTKRFFLSFRRNLSGNFAKNGAPEDAELEGVGR
jgi:hypothetical protein